MQEDKNIQNPPPKKGFFTLARMVVSGVFVLFGILGFAYFLFIKFTGISIPCFYYTNFGIKCPGCGLTRMFMALISLDFVSAFAFNPFVFCSLFLWFAVAVMVFIGKPKVVSKPWFLFSLLGITFLGCVVFTIMRNI